MSDEVSLIAAVAAVYSHDSGQWASIDGGLSKVFIFHNLVANIYRIIAMSTKDEQFILNTEIFKDLVYQKASTVFLQWKDFNGKVYGLNFHSPQDMEAFVVSLESVITILKNWDNIALPPPILDTSDIPPLPVDEPVMTKPTTTTTIPTLSPIPSHTTTPTATTAKPTLINTTNNNNHSSHAITNNNNSSSSSLTTSSGTRFTQSSSEYPTHSHSSLSDLSGGSDRDLLRGSTDSANSSEMSRKKIGTGNSSSFINLTSSTGSNNEDTPTKKRAGTLKVLKGFGTIRGKSSKGKDKDDKEDKIEATGINKEGVKLPKLVQQGQEELSARDLIVREIYTSEYNYVQQLNTMCNTFITQAKTNAVFTDEDVKQIFANVTVIRDVNKNLLDELFKPLDNWDQNTALGCIFLKMHHFFKMYTIYCNNYENSLQKVEELKKKSVVNTYLKNNENPSLQSLLITPVQRLPRYVLLLKELQKKTPTTHPDYNDLSSAVDKIGEIVEIINSKIKKSDSSKQFADLLKEKARFIGLESLVAPSREYLERGELTWNQAKTIYLLFNDLFVLASYDVKDKETDKDKMIKTIKEKIPVETLWITSPFNNGIELITPDQNFLVTDITNEGLFQTLTSVIESYVTKSGKGDFIKRNIKYSFTKGENAGSTYNGELANGKMNGQGTLVAQDGTELVGTWVDGKLHGQGTATYPDGSKYEGSWKEGFPSKKGILKTPLGKYDGKWKKGKKNSTGTLEWTNGDKYVGEWKNDLMNGKGDYTCSDTSVYSGMWKDGKRHGKGVFTSCHGWKYDGEWSDNMRNGDGEITYTNGDVYRCVWKADKKNGQGNYSNVKLKTSYIGSWVDDRYEGFGNLKSPLYNYDGNWKDNRKNGHGIATYPDGSKYDGDWKDDRRDGSGVWTGSKGEKYTGGWHSDKKFGRGKMEDAEMGTYDGAWVNDRKEGTGIIFYKNGDSYMGPWKSDTRNGEGVYTKANGLGKYAGGWEDGVKKGKGVLKDLDGTYDGEWSSNMKNGDGTFTANNGEVQKGKWKDNRKHGKFTIKKTNGQTVEIEYIDGVPKVQDFKKISPEMPTAALFN